MLMKIIGVIGILGVAFIAFGMAVGPTYGPNGLTGRQERRITESVSKSLRDPSSAKVKGLVSARKAEETVFLVCGYVNGKNAYGGYTGFVPFVGLYDNDIEWLTTLDIAKADISDDSRVLSICEDAGVNIY